ncbi:hypothetical protein PG985_014587 [Apiospora marii]|uniref:Uncharacterized protein n=1 Tax=Apiospora marii TaxID=335849 RepID=A0ABR1R5C3_9PEZI
MASHQKQEPTGTTRILLNFPCSHYRLWKVAPKGAAYLESIYVKKGATVEEGIILTDQQSCYACRWPETLKRFYLLPEWGNDDIFPSDGKGNGSISKVISSNMTQAELARHTKATRALRAYMATALIALFIQHPLLYEEQLAMLSCLWDRAAAELGRRIDFDFGRLADDVYEVVVALTDAAELNGGDDEVTAFLGAGQDMDVGALVAKIEEELAKPDVKGAGAGAGEDGEARLKKAGAPKMGPDARGVEGMIYRGQMLEEMAGPSVKVPSSSLQGQERERSEKKRAFCGGIRTRLFSKFKK